MKLNNLHINKDNVTLHGFNLQTLADIYQTPLIIYDSIGIDNQINYFNTHFASKHLTTQCIYASKALLVPAIINKISQAKWWVDATSLGELAMLDFLNVPRDHIIYHGNNKSDQELIEVITNGIRYLVIDNAYEARRVVELVSKYQTQLKVLLRINPGIYAQTHTYIQTGQFNSKFGIAVCDEELDAVIDHLNSSRYLSLEGFHCHIGSNVTNAVAYLQTLEVMVEFLSKQINRTKQYYPVLNLGGGFAIAYNDEDVIYDLGEMLEAIVTEAERLNEEHDLKLKMLMIEPGRTLVGPYGMTLYTAGPVKRLVTGRNLVFVNGGMTDNIRPALYATHYTVENLSRSGTAEVFDVVGPRCESGDIVSLNAKLVKPEPGDLIGVYGTGAYGYSMASNYNGAVKPAVVFVGEDLEVTVKREAPQELIKDFELNVPVFDCHTDILFDLYERNDPKRFAFHRHQLKHSVIKGGVWTLYSESDFPLIPACESALSQIDWDELHDFPVILGLEGLRNLNQPSDLDVLYQMGFRHAMLTWNEQNQYGSGAKQPETSGLTELGREVVKRMDELGMIVDLAHTNDTMFDDIAKLKPKRVIYSHGNIRALCNHPRNVTDHQLQTLKALDGLLGLTLAGSFVSENKADRTIARFIDHVDYAVRHLGIDHVCFGFDFMDYLSGYDENFNLEAVPTALEAYKILGELWRRGYTREEIEKIAYRNFYERFKDLVYNKGAVK